MAWKYWLWRLGQYCENSPNEKKSPEEQKAYIKKLWQEDPVKYAEWKQYCIDVGALPNLFGHANNPIPIDESNL